MTENNTILSKDTCTVHRHMYMGLHTPLHTHEALKFGPNFSAKSSYIFDMREFE